MNNDSIAEREGRELERAAIVKWLRDRAAAWRRHHTASVKDAHDNELADSVEGLAAAIERCAHRSGS